VIGGHKGPSAFLLYIILLALFSYNFKFRKRHYFSVQYGIARISLANCLQPALRLRKDISIRKRKRFYEVNQWFPSVVVSFGCGGAYCLRLRLRLHCACSFLQSAIIFLYNA